jgi:BMFP domain-containing protein YqiC
MSDKKKLVEDVMTLGNAIVGNVLGARHELKAQAKQKFDLLSQQLNLVSRAEFDAAFAMLAKARTTQDELQERLTIIESHLNLSRASAKGTKAAKGKSNMKVNLPSVKRSKSATRRK